MDLIVFNEFLSPFSDLSNLRVIVGIHEFIESWFEVKVVLGAHEHMAYVWNQDSLVGTIPANYTTG